MLKTALSGSRSIQVTLDRAGTPETVADAAATISRKPPDTMVNFRTAYIAGSSARHEKEFRARTTTGTAWIRVRRRMVIPAGAVDRGVPLMYKRARLLAVPLSMIARS
jgi:hypothetical protein